MNCLFIEAGSEHILIDTGIGEKWSAKAASMYGINRQRSLCESIRTLVGIAPEEITMVINTHLHFDHAGGNTRLDEGGSPVATFPNARYLVSRAEYEHAESPSDRDRASYISDNWNPLLKSGQLELKDEDYEAVPGVSMETYVGHNRTMQCLRLRRGGQTLFGFSDLIPTRAHVSYAWIMGYDLYPMDTLHAKKKLLPEAAREGWFCLFYHDPDTPLCRILSDDGKLTAEPV